MQEMRQIIALFMLSICAYTDIKEKNIYIMPLIISAAGAAAMSAADALFLQNPAPAVNEILLPAAAGIAVILLVRMKSVHVGIGDGYMTAALGMIIGTGRCFLSVAAGLAAASLYAGAMIIAAKKRLHHRLPFAPFVMAGYMFMLFYGS